MNTIYIDVLFLINFSLDYMSLYLTGRALRLPMRRWRMIAVACLLALYALWALLLCSTYFLLILTAVLTGLLGCIVAFHQRKVKAVLHAFFIFTGISCALAGCLMLLYRLLAFLLRDVETRDNGMKVLVFILLAAISGILIALGNHFLTDVRGTKAVRVTIELAKKTGEFHLLLDSGNLVREPVSGKCVVFLGEHAAIRAFGKSICQSDYLPERRRVICMTTVNGKEMLLAFRPDDMLLKGKHIDAVFAVLPHVSVQQYDGIFPAALFI